MIMIIGLIVPIEIWRQTDGGDQNPLNMLPGFRELELEDDQELQTRIDLFKQEHNLISEQPELVLLPNNNARSNHG